MAESGYPKNIEDLVSEQVSGVCFVQDYLELHFNGPVVRFEEPPSIRMNNKDLTFPSPGSRDAFCALIGLRLVSVKIVEEVSMTFRFEKGEILFVPLSSTESSTGEFVHFMPSMGGPMQVW
jgi:hypothetical protein